MWDVIFWTAVAICAMGSAWVISQIWKEARQLRAQQRAYDKAQHEAVERQRRARQNYARFVARSVVRDRKPWEHQP